MGDRIILRVAVLALALAVIVLSVRIAQTQAPPPPAPSAPTATAPDAPTHEEPDQPPAQPAQEADTGGSQAEPAPTASAVRWHCWAMDIPGTVVRTRNIDAATRLGAYRIWESDVSRTHAAIASGDGQIDCISFVLPYLNSLYAGGTHAHEHDHGSHEHEHAHPHTSHRHTPTPTPVPLKSWECDFRRADGCYHGTGTMRLRLATLAEVEQHVRDTDPFWTDGASELVCRDRS